MELLFLGKELCFIALTESNVVMAIVTMASRSSRRLFQKNKLREFNPMPPII